MRHHRDHRQLSRTAEHRRALLRSLVTALFQYERIETTVAKAKETRRVAERMITYAKKNNIHSRRLVARVVQDDDVAKKLFDTITPWYATRQGGYTRILKTRRRLGDAGELAIIELVKSDEQKDADRKVRAARAEASAKAKEAKAKAKGEAEKVEEKTDEKAKEKAEAKAKKKAEAKTAEAKKVEKAEAKAPKAEVRETKAEKKPKTVEKPAAKKEAAKPKKEEPKKKGGGLLGRIRRKKEDS
ncbi:MAG: 50S ribosomal protein L17 [Candidatus Eisenbacteria bacterium]|nr:50S ribosomal protein L17 [Candidatus Eisenbacteria bacterium]